MATVLTVCSPRGVPSSSSSSVAAPAEQDCRRQYAPSLWGDFFITHQPWTPEELMSMENKAQAKKEEVRQIVLDAAAVAATSGDLVRKLELVDALQRLGVDYHYKEEIDAVLRAVHDDHHDNGADDLYVTSLRFYLLRKHGYAVSSDVFVRFRDEQGNVSSDDVDTLMLLYDAAHMRTHGEDILDSIISFSKSRLQTAMKSADLDPDVAEEVRVTLETPRFRRAQRVEARRFIWVYEKKKKATRDDAVLEFAKQDYNLVQSVYCQELKELSIWWKDLRSRLDLSFARDRLVEMYCWMMIIVYEPYYSRKMQTKMVLFFALLDDIYDNYSTSEESDLFTAAMERWDGTAENVPEHLKPFFKAVIRTTDEVVAELKRENNKHAEVVKEVVLHVIRSYHAEVKWRDEHYVPAGLDEHLQLSLDSIMCLQSIVLTFVTIGDVTTRETIDAAFNYTKIVRAATVMARVMNDIMSHEREQASDHVASTVETCMKEHGFTLEEAIEKLTGVYEQGWMDMVEEGLDKKFPKAILDKVVNVGQSVDFIYKRDDSYTTPSTIKDTIAALYARPV